jgi:hypothetical protein
MSFSDPKVRRLFDLEGLKKWLPGRTEGYKLLSEAVNKFHYLEAFVSSVTARCT